MRVSLSHVSRDYRGSDVGLALYDSVRKLADEKGLRLASDSSVSAEAARIYRSLSRSGVRIKTNPHTVHPTTGQLVSDDPRLPVFEISDAPTRRQVTTEAHGIEDIHRAFTGPRGEAEAAQRLAAALRAGDASILAKDSGGDSVRWADLDGTEESLNGLSQSFEEFFAEELRLATAGGRMSLEEISRRAARTLEDDHGVIVNLHADLAKDERLAGRLMASDLLLTEAKKKAIALAKKITAGKATDAERKLFDAQLRIAGALIAKAKGSITETARALRGLAVNKAQRQATDEEFSNAMRELGTMRDYADVAKELTEKAGDLKAVGDLIERSSGEKLLARTLEVLYGNLLSAPTTHIANTIGNAYKLVQALVERPVAFGIGKLKQPFGAQSDRVTAAELRGLYFGLFQGTRDAFRLSMPFLVKASRTNPLSKASRTELRNFVKEQERLGTLWKAIVTNEPQTDSITKGAGIGGRRKELVFEMPAGLEDDATALKRALHGLKLIGAQFGNVAGRAIRIPGGIIMTVDEVFKTIGHRMQMWSEAYKNADEVMKHAPAEHQYEGLRALAGEYLDNPELQHRAVQFAREQTFQQKLGKFGTGLEQFAGRVPAIRFIVPFLRTPVNLFREAVYELTPLPFLKAYRKQGREKLLKGGAEADMEIARSLIGSYAVYEVYSWASEGKIKGSGSRTNSSYLDNVPAYSIKIGDTWHAYNRLDPIGMLVGLVADLHEGWEESTQDDEATNAYSTMMVAAISAVSRNAVSKTWLSGLSDAVNAMSDAERYAGDWAASMGANLIPFVGSSLHRRIAAADDPFAREAFTFMDELRKRFAWNVAGVGSRKDLGIMRDPLGRPIKNDVTTYSVIRSETESESFLDRKLAELDFHISEPSRSISGVPLDTKQYSRLLELRGQVLRDNGRNLQDALFELVQMPEFESFPEEGQRDLINQLAGRYNAPAREVLKQEDDELREKVEQAMRDKAKERSPITKRSTEPPSAAAAQALRAILQPAGF